MSPRHAGEDEGAGTARSHRPATDPLARRSPRWNRAGSAPRPT